MTQQLIIDFLGTFIDSHAMYQALSAEQDLAALDTKVCVSLPEILAQSGKVSKSQVMKKLQSLLKDKPLAFKPCQALIDSLGVLKQAGFHLGLLAAGLTQPAQLICDEHELDLFDFIEGDLPFFSRDALLGRVLKKYAIKPAEVLYLSGTLKNLHLAQYYKVKAIANNWGIDSLEDLQKGKPTYTILTPGELLTVMTEELVV